jgi:hypothetical protein
VSLSTRLLRKFSFVRALERRLAALGDEVAGKDREIQELRAEIAKWTRFSPHGHFYSPLASEADISAAFSRKDGSLELDAIAFNEPEQFALFKKLAAFSDDFPFRDERAVGRRYQLRNSSYSPFDAFVLYGMIRFLKPRRLIEVGCGYTSSAILDLNDLLFDGRMELTFIDPDLAEFRRRLLPNEVVKSTLIEKPVQEVPMEVFGALEPNDILFLDTSHVSKVGSDVNHLLFKVLPALKPGVWIHIHDVTSDFEYPKDWLEGGRSWNEIYLLRAFLMYNRSFEIMLSSAFLYNSHIDFFPRQMPVCSEGGGGQIWLKKTGDPVDSPGSELGRPATASNVEPVEISGTEATVAKSPQPGDGLINFSSRGYVGAGQDTLSCGFVVGGASDRTLLIRAVGPGLISAGLAGALAQAQLQLFDSNPAHSKEGRPIIASILGWGKMPNVGLSTVPAKVRAASAEAMASVGAFPLSPGGSDSAMIVTLPPGIYSAGAAGVARGTGVVLLEIYEMR